jgi:hypothetical protein
MHDSLGRAVYSTLLSPDARILDTGLVVVAGAR